MTPFDTVAAPRACMPKTPNPWPHAGRPIPAGAARATTPPGHCAHAPALPGYLRDIYSWAYLRRDSVRLLDSVPVVETILWGNYRRLQRVVLAELRPGQTVLQPACVYGDLSSRIVKFLGPRGRLDVSDVAPVQVDNCRRKLGAFGNATVRLHDAAEPVGRCYDVVCCFFLLHEMPDDYRRRVVDALLDATCPDGKVVFVDYHRPRRWHPLRGVMSLVFDRLEPFAKGLWDQDIAQYASDSDAYVWTKRTYFGGLYQKVVARKR